MTLDAAAVLGRSTRQGRSLYEAIAGWFFRDGWKDGDGGLFPDDAVRAALAWKIKNLNKARGADAAFAAGQAAAKHATLTDIHGLSYLNSRWFSEQRELAASLLGEEVPQELLSVRSQLAAGRRRAAVEGLLATLNTGFDSTGVEYVEEVLIELGWLKPDVDNAAALYLFSLMCYAPDRQIELIRTVDMSRLKTIAAFLFVFTPVVLARRVVDNIMVVRHRSVHSEILAASPFAWLMDSFPWVLGFSQAAQLRLLLAFLASPGLLEVGQLTLAAVNTPQEYLVVMPLFGRGVLIRNHPWIDAWADAGAQRPRPRSNGSTEEEVTWKHELKNAGGISTSQCLAALRELGWIVDGYEEYPDGGEDGRLLELALADVLERTASSLLAEWTQQALDEGVSPYAVVGLRSRSRPLFAAGDETMVSHWIERSADWLMSVIGPSSDTDEPELYAAAALAQAALLVTTDADAPRAEHSARITAALDYLDQAQTVLRRMKSNSDSGGF